MPAYSFGTATRDRQHHRVFISEKHSRHKATSASPGPVYSTRTDLGTGPRCVFGSEDRSDKPRQIDVPVRYPDSSVDLMCLPVDSQKVKFPRAKGVHFGTEMKMSVKNAEIIKSHPAAYTGVNSPGAAEYEPNDKCAALSAPAYSMGPKQPRFGEKLPPRLQVPPHGTPHFLGPGSHVQPSSLGDQPTSLRRTAPSFSFGSERRDNSLVSRSKQSNR